MRLHFERYFSHHWATQMIKSRTFKRERKFLKNCQLTSYLVIFGQRTFFSITKLVFREKRESYLLSNNVIFKDRVLFKWTQSSIEIDVIVVKKNMSI